MFQAFTIGPIHIWLHAVFMLLGIWLAVEFFLRLARSANLSLSHFKEHAWWYLVAFALSGRIFAIVAHYRAYIKDPLRLLIVWDGGFSFLGGAIGIGILLMWITRAHRTTFLQWLDVLLPATCFGLVFDWLGRFLAGQAYGKPTDVFWGVTYDTPSVRYVVPVHPVQLYYALFFFALTFLLLVIRKHSKRAGSETLYGIIIATLGTFLFEYLRGDFSIPVFAYRMDFIVLILFFASLGLYALTEKHLTEKAILLYQIALVVVVGGYLIVVRGFVLEHPTMEFRISQFLAILALFASIVYVAVHRLRHPHL